MFKCISWRPSDLKTANHINVIALEFINNTRFCCLSEIHEFAQ